MPTRRSVFACRTWRDVEQLARLVVHTHELGPNLRTLTQRLAPRHTHRASAVASHDGEVDALAVQVHHMGVGRLRHAAERLHDHQRVVGVIFVHVRGNGVDDILPERVVDHVVTIARVTFEHSDASVPTAAQPSLSDEAVQRLRAALADAGYLVDTVERLLGERASAALNRNATVPARLVASGNSPLELLIQLWRLQRSVPARALDRVIPVDDLVAGGLLERVDDGVRALVDVRPYADDAGDWWVVADLTPGLDGAPSTVGNDHVLGLNAASSTLAQLTVRRPVERALDLGTGCGVQALHLSRHCDTVVATDVNPRAVAMAALTARLNGLDVDLRTGDLYAPVADESFDLITTNPPFVVSPGGQQVYRDSGLAGDDVTRRVLIEGAERLRPGGVLQSLGNWMHVRGQDWQDRLGAWIERTGCDAWIIEREVQDPAEYIELWLRDSGETTGPAHEHRYEEWLRWFDEHHVEGIGFGWINLHASGAQQPTVRVEEWTHSVQQPFGPTVDAWFERADTVRLGDDALLATHLVVADDIVLEQIGEPGAADPSHLVLRQYGGMRRAVHSDPAEAGVLGACDGTLPLGVIIDAVAQLVSVEPQQLRTDVLPGIRTLIQDGFLHAALPA